MKLEMTFRDTYFLLEPILSTYYFSDDKISSRSLNIVHINE